MLLLIYTVQTNTLSHKLQVGCRYDYRPSYFNYRYYLTVYLTARQPAPQDFNMTMAVSALNSTKDGGIASSILVVQLQMMY